MFKRLLLALALIGALAACNTPAGTASPSGVVTSPTASGVVSSPAASPSGVASPSGS